MEDDVEIRGCSPRSQKIFQYSSTVWQDIFFGFLTFVRCEESLAFIYRENDTESIAYHSVPVP
jgi:hypothetical protein